MYDVSIELFPNGKAVNFVAASDKARGLLANKLRSVVAIEELEDRLAEFANMGLEVDLTPEPFVAYQRRFCRPRVYVSRDRYLHLATRWSLFASHPNHDEAERAVARAFAEGYAHAKIVTEERFSAEAAR